MANKDNYKSIVVNTHMHYYLPQFKKIIALALTVVESAVHKISM